MKLVNGYDRRRGIATGGTLKVLEKGGEMDVTEYQLDKLRKHPHVSVWLKRGLLKVEEGDAKKSAPNPNRAVRAAPPLPEGIPSVGVHLHASPGGWYRVYVNGIDVVGRLVRKKRAEEVALEYA